MSIFCCIHWEKCSLMTKDYLSKADKHIGRCLTTFLGLYRRSKDFHNFLDLLKYFEGPSNIELAFKSEIGWHVSSDICWRFRWTVERFLVIVIFRAFCLSEMLDLQHRRTRIESLLRNWFPMRSLWVAKIRVEHVIDPENHKIGIISFFLESWHFTLSENS